MSTLRTDTLESTDSTFSIDVKDLAPVKSVDSIAALKLLLSVNSSAAQVTGYYTAGDGGGGLYKLDPLDVTTPDNKGTVIVANDGGRWKLTYQGALNVRQFGAKCDGVTDDYLAILAAHSASAEVVYPTATIVCSQQVVVPAPFGFRGDGINKTVILFTGATKGFRVTQASSAQGIVFDGASLQTNTDSLTTVALMLDGSSQYTGDDTVLRIIGDRTSYRCRVENVDCRGSTDSSGWGMGVQFHSVINFSSENIVYRGVIPANPSLDNLKGYGIVVSGNGAVVDFSIRRYWGFYAEVGILMPDYLEGGHIYDYEMVAVKYGILSRFTPGVSVLPAGLCGSLGMHLGNGHVNCQIAGILLEKTNQAHITNQNIYLQTRAIDAPAICLQITSGNWSTIDSIFCNGDSALNTKTLNSGVILSATGLSNVTNISGSSLLSAVTLIESSGNDLDNLRSAFCTYVINGDGTSTNNYVGKRRAQSNTGAKYSLGVGNNIHMDEFSTTFLQPFSSQSSFTIDVAVPAGVFSEAPLFASLVADSGAISFNSQYSYDTSTATSVKFFVTPQPPAVNLGVATIRFSMNSKGN
jgi:hypothetical protein